MKCIKVKTGYGINDKASIEEIYIIDSPLQNNWDLLCAIQGAQNSINEIIDTVYWWRSTTKNKEAKKAIEKVIDNLFFLVKKYQEENGTLEIPKAYQEEG